MSSEHNQMGSKSLKAQDASKKQIENELPEALPKNQPTRPSISHENTD